MIFVSGSSRMSFNGNKFYILQSGCVFVSLASLIKWIRQIALFRTFFKIHNALWRSRCHYIYRGIGTLSLVIFTMKIRHSHLHKLRIVYVVPPTHPMKGIQDSLGLWTPCRGFRIPSTGFRFFVSGTWIPDSKAHDFGFHMKKFLDSLTCDD